MAKKKFLKGSEEWVMFMDYWTLCQELWGIEDTEAYWQEVADKVETFRKKHPGSFARRLTNALLDELMERSRTCQ